MAMRKCQLKLAAMATNASLWQRVASGQLRCLSDVGGDDAADEQQRHRLRCYAAEFDKQRGRHERTLEKIEVQHIAQDGQATVLYMNRRLSTPHDVAKHLSEELASQSALAVVDGKAWDMHRPLVASCSIRFLHFRSPTSREDAMGLKTCNTALWRAGSFLLGSVIETAFSNSYRVKLISFPPPYLRAGSFVYDCQVQDSSGAALDWSPSKAELRALSNAGEKLSAAELNFQPLDIGQEAALEMFKHNDVKQAAVRSIISANPDKFATAYRVGDFVDISTGPLIANTSLIGRFIFSAIHTIETKDFGQLLRVQGLAIPRTFLTHFSSVELLTKRAAVINKSFHPTWPARVIDASDADADAAVAKEKS